MADDVFQDAARQPPDPRTNDYRNNNNYQAQLNNEEKMEKNQAGIKENITSRKFYDNTSTTVYGTLSPNNNNNPTTSTNSATSINSIESVVKDSTTPIINNYPVQRRLNSSINDVPHQTSTTTNTSTTILVQPPTPSTPNISNTRATTSNTTPVNMDISMEMPSSNIPPIEPFTLGSNNSPKSPSRRRTPLDMRQLQTATKAASNQQNLPVLPTSINEEESSTSLSPMDTADVSTINLKLLPKPVNNPYSKQAKKASPALKTPISTTTYKDQKCTNDCTTSLSKSITTTTVNKSTDILPTAATTTPPKQVVENNGTTGSIDDNDKITPLKQNQEFQELSQDELQLVNIAIAEHEQTSGWTEVPTKPTKGPYTPERKEAKPVHNNPYCPLQ
jgi:hypothetical protein